MVFFPMSEPGAEGTRVYWRGASIHMLNVDGVESSCGMFVWHPHCISSWFWAYLFLIVKRGKRTSLAFWMHFTVKVHWVRGFPDVWLPFRVDVVDSYPVYPGIPSLSVPDALAQNFWAAQKNDTLPWWQLQLQRNGSCPETSEIVIFQRCWCHPAFSILSLGDHVRITLW